MNAKLSVFIICVEAIIYFLLYNLHDYTFKLYFLFNTQNHDVCKTQEFPQSKHVHSSVDRLLKKMLFKFSTMSCSCNAYPSLLCTYLEG